MRILIRTSRLAIWSRRLAIFGFAVLVLAVTLHLLGQIATNVFEISLIIGTTVSALAVSLAVAAYARLWFTGDRGWKLASIGFSLGALCLMPAGYALAMAMFYPSTADVTTALVSPPSLLSVEDTETSLDPESILQSFPNLITRSYQIPPETLFGLAETLVRQRGWRVVRNSPPAFEGGQGTLNAIRTSLLGWENEIAYRIAPGPLGALIDLRAASLNPTRHDLGENGRAIESFLLALDDSVSAYVQANLGLGDDDVLHDVIVEDDEPESES